MRLRSPAACQPDCALCAPLLLDAQSAPETLRAKLAHAEQTDQRRVYLQGSEVALSPHLPTLLSVKPQALQLTLVEDGPGLGLPARAPWLREMGITQVYVSLASPPEAAQRSPDSRKPALALLLGLTRDRDVEVGVHVPLSRRAAKEVPAVLRLQARLGVRELLISEVLGGDITEQPLQPAAALAALERVWLAANAQNVRLRVVGFERTRYVTPPVGPPAPSCDSGLLDIIRLGIPLALPAAGIRISGESDRISNVKRLVRNPEELRTLGLELAGRRTPLVDVPPCLGGTPSQEPVVPTSPNVTFIKAELCQACAFDARCPGAPSGLDVWPSSPLRSALRPLPSWPHRPPPRVLVLSSSGGDPLFYISTLPALAEALKRRGVTAEIVSPWASRWSPDSLPSLSPRADNAEWMSTADVEHWLGRHDLGGFDLVITSDFPTARAALAAESLNPAARIVVTDFHMLEAMDRTLAVWLAPGARAADGGWWPTDRLILESGFPGYVQLYRNYGVPLEQIVWRPYSLCPGHFTADTDVHQYDVIFSGGNHLRDLETLRAATELLPAAVHPVDLYDPGDRFEGNHHLRHRGRVDISLFWQALATSRFMVLPLRENATRAAGITVLAMALMAGRPVVATATASMRDYVQHGEEGLLVPPGDPEALANAITQLDTDPALLTALAEGARRTGQRMTTEHWAAEIAAGTPPAPRRTRFGWRNW